MSRPDRRRCRSRARHPVLWLGLLLAAAAAVPRPLPAQTQSAQTPPAQKEGVQKAGIEPRLRIVLAAAPTSLDPHQHNFAPNQSVAFHLYEPLVWRDGGGQRQPLLAQDWQETAPRRWSLQLRPGLRFQDGRPLTARDAVYSYCRAQAMQGDRLSFAPLLRDIAGIAAPAPDRLVFDFRRRFSELPYALAGIVIVAAPAEFPAGALWRPGGCTDAAGRPLAWPAESGLPVGSGPYRLAAPDGTGLTSLPLRRNEAYWGSPPAWPNILLTVIEDDQRRIRALGNGNADLVEQVPPGSVAALRSGGFTVLSAPANRLMHLQMEQQRDALPDLQDTGGRNPFRDLRVRRAISLGIDRPALVERVMGGFAIPVWQLVRDDMEGYAPGMTAGYDPAEARRLLAEAGYGGGFAVRLLAPDGRYANDRRIAEAVGAMLLPLGIRVTVEAQPPAEFFTIRARERAAFFLAGNAISTASTAVRALALAPDPAHGRGTSNHGDFRDPEVDRLYDQAMAASEPADQDRLMAAANRRASEQLAVIPLFYGQTLWGLRPGLAMEPRLDQLTLATGLRPQ